jgi:hypothetical protein
MALMEMFVAARQRRSTQRFLIQVNIDWGWLRIQGDVPRPGRAFFTALAFVATEVLHRLLGG